MGKPVPGTPSTIQMLKRCFAARSLPESSGEQVQSVACACEGDGLQACLLLCSDQKA